MAKFVAGARFFARWGPVAGKCLVIARFGGLSGNPERESALDERRRTTRFNVGRTTVATIAGVTHVVQVIDVSYGGLQIATTEKPEVGTKIALDDGEGNVIKGRVVRHTPSGVALHVDFDESSATYALKSITGNMIKDG